MKREPRIEPAPRTETLRQAILRHLRDGPLTARELSERVQISEKEVVPHLDHLRQSLRRADERLVLEPAECLACGFRFRKRRRLTKPSACPRCRAQRIDPPVFHLERLR
jgi:predicted Zn-ribbon and HTH transcriptional regulator